MASITSIGLSLPAGLPFAIQEKYLPKDAPKSSYTWKNYTNQDVNCPFNNDELLVTPRCVIWSRRGVFRKCYNFDVEKESISHALLTTFPSVGPLAGKRDNQEKKIEVSNSKEAAIVVFLKTQAHVYFLFGTSHVIHLPFEVESAFAAPNGVIMQRKLEVHIVNPVLKTPQTPQNSFVSSLQQPWSSKGSRQSSFSISDVGESRQISFPPATKIFSEPWITNLDTNWPRLFSISDPFSEIGLIVAQQPISDRSVYKKCLPETYHLDAAEELIHVSCQEDFKIGNLSRSPVVAVTWNKENCEYSIWKLDYSGGKACIDDRAKLICRDMSRRRSSYAPTTATGNSTPHIIGQQSVRDSNYGKNSIKLRKGFRIDGSQDNFLDLVSALEPDFENQSIPRRKSRRISSMLARVDFSNSHDRSTFSDLVTCPQHIINRRGGSLGSQHIRTSLGGVDTLSSTTLSQISQSSLNITMLNDYLAEKAIDENHNGDNYEEFSSLGLESAEFNTLNQEIFLTKIRSVSSECCSLRYSTEKKPAQTQCKVFTMAVPSSPVEDTRGDSNLICIFDHIEKKLFSINLHTKIERPNDDLNISKKLKSENGVHIVSLGPILRAENVIDACKIDDGQISRILVLSETENGFRELTLQAPWSFIMKIPLPINFLSTSLRVSRFQGECIEPLRLCGLHNSRPSGYVDLLDNEENLHQIRILLQPRNPHVYKILDTCRELFYIHGYGDPNSSNRADGILVCWWSVMQWLSSESLDIFEPEWTALTITLLVTALGVDYTAQLSKRINKTKLRDSSRYKVSDIRSRKSNESWELMLAEETGWGNPLPSWTQNAGWAWLATEADVSNSQDNGRKEPVSIFDRNSDLNDSFIQRHVKLARQYLTTLQEQRLMLQCLPTWSNKTVEARMISLQNIFIGLHLLREEQKLNVLTSDSFNTGGVNLTIILAQVVRWLGWPNWIDFYKTEEASLFDSDFDDDNPIKSNIKQPYDCPSIYNWIQRSLMTRSSCPFITIPNMGCNSIRISDKYANELCSRLTPRTLILKKFFDLVTPDWTPTQVVQSFSQAGGDIQILDTLPEAILVPLQEAITRCQSDPSSTWNSKLLALVGREDVNISLTPGLKPREIQPKTSVAPHESNMDVHRICMDVFKPETTGVFSGTAEVDRLSVTRLIFKDDKRFNEAVQLLDTISPTVTICDAQPQWSESELLEAQKEHAQTIAYRTLAISSGRGLLYFSSRIPLLTQKWTISGFNLSCSMKPDNIVVTADKSAFTEEKVCWAFFHAGVAAGLQISRDAKGIDTSWILFNKPLSGTLNNRHAGFLLALGLNGHLKSLAKWVAFKYLTPKHTMTSIGLLLGLAASYIGSMDTLITRLLSVHITRMLPPGAADLNLSPLTQTTGIMGIGLLYYNTQHRRMSEIMVSEIEHIDSEIDEKPFRDEGYRLAAGFALGLINLGKGSDLKGLYDMRLTERLLTQATGSKKVDLIHVLDKASAAAVMGITLIFMKSENQILARKIDIPDSLVQFDYVRPDIFLLRTLASRLIMWRKIEPSFEWIQSNLPEEYQPRSKLASISSLSTEDLAFYNIVTGLCFSIALRYAGSADFAVRDLLVYYLDQFMRIFGLKAPNYDTKLTQITVRHCQDLLALSAATVMAGTGDLLVFRRLRSLHGRDDAETPYGSHLAAHIAAGALFLGGGTFTFGTSNLAIASLLIAFYPIFPNSVHDNRSHLQAFRHFWSLAAEPRCFIVKDIETNQPVSVPIIIIPRTGSQYKRLMSPCLVPELDQIKIIRTDSSDFWNLSLDLETNHAHMTVFKSTQTIYVSRRPAHLSAVNPFHASFLALSDAENNLSHPLEWIFNLPAFKSLSKAERALVLPSSTTVNGVSDRDIDARGTVVDVRLVLENAVLESGKKDRLLGLKLLFDWVDRAASENRNILWIRKEVVERLKTKMWIMIMNMSRNDTN
ncbi:putative negative regulator of mitosis negative regulator of mitosis [Erysiphe necator]|uniref:Putative negative regulator of mitosis negative regulator of mitosis n=1 Tax=Uncinula necator TaxID=52586 RepID=A0A0B1P6U5_UNCNE|nr:putative negative regulator of mitosis negative regulator of mitosis [Erysiphe necator]